jgi:hypothetical protein
MESESKLDLELSNSTKKEPQQQPPNKTLRSDTGESKRV